MLKGFITLYNLKDRDGSGMTEFWVSRPKHFCTLCKVWCQGDPVSIKRHEEAPGHKNKLAHRLKAKRQSRQHPHSSDVAAQLSQIEAAAAASMRQTAASGAFAGAINTNEFLSTEHSQPHRSGGGRTRDGGGRFEGDPTADFYENFNARSFQDDGKNAGEEEEEDLGGEYVVKGTRYFQGKAHAEKFRTGSDCQVWVESAESWLPGVIKRVKRYGSASGEERVFDVEVAAKDDEELTGESRVEKHLRRLRRNDTLMVDVDAKDIRVAGDPTDGVWRPPKSQPIPEMPTTVAEVDAHTGLGKWTTVSVRQVDEEEEERKRARRESQQAKREAKAQAAEQRAKDEARAASFLEENRQALNSHLGVYDRVDVYKGVKLVKDEDEEKAVNVVPTTKVEEEEEESGISRAFSFKKRKVENTRFRKKIATRS